MKTILKPATGLYNIEKARLVAQEMAASDLDWTYKVVDCNNGFGRIDIYDEDNELVVKGFLK
jgi:hypothetical protein